jgi:acyl-CoA thioesterase-1
VLRLAAAGGRLLLAAGGMHALAATAAAPTPPDATATAPARPIVLILGDSLTSGYGIDPDEAYPARLQKKITAAGLPHRVINAGLSGDTSAGGLRRIDWMLRQPVAVFVVALGGNDGLRGVDPAETRRNLLGILRRVRERNPEARLVVAGMEMSPTMGRDYTDAFRATFPAVAAETGAALIPFLLDGVGGRPDLNLPDGIHPTPEGHRRIAEVVWPVLEPILRETAAGTATP